MKKVSIIGLTSILNSYGLSFSRDDNDYEKYSLYYQGDVVRSISKENSMTVTEHLVYLLVWYIKDLHEEQKRLWNEVESEDD